MRRFIAQSFAPYRYAREGGPVKTEDDPLDPAPARDSMPVLADVVGAKPPRHIPSGLARLFMGEGLAMMTESRGAANARAKKELDWTLRYPTWRQGFRAAYGQH